MATTDNLTTTEWIQQQAAQFWKEDPLASIAEVTGRVEDALAETDRLVGEWTVQGIVGELSERMSGEASYFDSGTCRDCEGDLASGGAGHLRQLLVAARAEGDRMSDRNGSKRRILIANMRKSAERRRCPSCNRSGGLGPLHVRSDFDLLSDRPRQYGGTCRYCGHETGRPSSREGR